MILIEGIDKCGKTSLATALRKQLKGWSYRGHTRPRMDPYRYFSSFIADSHPRVVVDRMHLSDVAYERAMRPGTEVLSDHQFRLIELANMCRGTTLYYVDDDPDLILERWDKDEMYTASLASLTSLRVHFLEQFARSKLRKVVIRDILDYIDLSTGKLLTAAGEMTKDAKLRAAVCDQLPPPSIGMGDRFGFMIIGESVNDNQHTKDYTPQAPFSKGPASEFLWAALDRANVPWWRGYYTNADDWDAETLKSLIHVVQPRVVVSLGSKAQELTAGHRRFGLSIPSASGRQPVRFAELRHPQSAKRFGGKHEVALQAYAEELEEAVLYTPEEMGTEESGEWWFETPE